ncbi:MAG TPA: hypothetical protein VFB32_04305 [Rudaea sp.]|nr:hypothetical protein [Rudaea sp.]
MLLITPNLSGDDTSHVRNVRVVWQQRYEGIAQVAYHGGRAVAGVSGPWSGRYVLTWWEPMLGGQLEIFETVEQAMAAVEQKLRESGPGRTFGRATDAARQPRRPWLARLRAAFRRPHRSSALVQGSLDALRRSYQRQDTDLSGLNFGASR